MVDMGRGSSPIAECFLYAEVCTATQTASPSARRERRHRSWSGRREGQRLHLMCDNWCCHMRDAFERPVGTGENRHGGKARAMQHRKLQGGVSTHRDGSYGNTAAI
eukprot:CAMPEP_0178397954 /NCGR_PEP_ID=MMETSP0689_2-20121128/14524_1 /TAXON_ID=160604 /ORGANISM="Amphidinium massartii, Strain CS-259" /LENGTH=105 /DNA_ID=CAMNT_0020018703 /DNA_START=860 /DNA_END=1175 /DNA_ORIENTATION=-